MRRLLLLTCVLTLGVAPQALAQSPPVFTGFHSVLAFGEGQGTSSQDLAAYEANGTVPPADLSQDRLYEGLEQAWPGFTAADLDRYYKNSDFQPRPAAGTISGLLGQLGTVVTGSPPNVEQPRAGVLIVRDPTSQVPRIYADTRAEGMWAAGYVTAEDRLFFMDVLRHVAQGTEAQLLGASAAASDSTELGVQDDSPQYLDNEMHALPTTMGAEGGQALSDIESYVDGINAFIDLTKMDPARLPAEYAALGTLPQQWTLADTAALGVYLIGQFTVFGGQQPEQAEALRMAIRRLGRRRGTAVYDDLRLAADPEAVTTLAHRFASDRPGRVNPRSVALIDPGSLVARNAQTGGPGSPAAAASAREPSRLPVWARQLATRGLRLPHLESNAVLVDARRSGTGQALAVMGPQVGY